MEKRICISLVTGLVWLFCARTMARAETITLSTSEDTTISEKSLDLPLGSEVTLDSGTTGPNEGLKKNRVLVKFDVSSIPSNAVINSAALTLTLVTSPTSTNLWFSLHKVLQDWTESAATWTNRLSPPAPWNAPGGMPETDFAGSVTQSNLIRGASVPATFTFGSNARMVNDVQQWTGNPGSNFGWILLCEQEDLERSVRKFGSSERSTTNQRPSLLVEFSLAAPSLSMSVLPISTNGEFQFEFNAESNTSYTVLYVMDFSSTNWNILTNVLPLTTASTVLITDPITNGNRFYRVQTP